MNRTQLKVLWIGIAIFVLMALFPPVEHERENIWGRYWVVSYKFILNAGNIAFTRLFIQWIVVAVIAGGLIYSLKVDPELLLKIKRSALNLYDEKIQSNKGEQSQQGGAPSEQPGNGKELGGRLRWFIATISIVFGASAGLAMFYYKCGEANPSVWEVILWGLLPAFAGALVLPCLIIHFLKLLRWLVLYFGDKVKVHCPKCGRSLRGATKEMIGDTGVCPKCKAEFVIMRDEY